ncbi:MAG: UbiA family prenyltransferase [candidate division Zixibacteria bacterium]|nr:UbiA family prenyltransferase [candidate division Zixibacteria bacterium]
MKLLDLIFAARPMLHLPGWSIFLVSLHYHHQISGGSFSAEDIFVMLGITLMTAGGMYVNQVFDVESDKINRKLGFITLGYLSERTMMIAFLVTSITSVMIGWIVSFVTVALLIQAFAISWIYSAPPFRLKDRAFFGMLANGWAFGWLVSFAVMPDIGVNTAGKLGWDNPFYFFYVVMAVHCLTTIPDRTGDKATGKMTIAVVLGPKLTGTVAILLYSFALGTAWRSEFLPLAILAGIALTLSLLALLWPALMPATLAAKLPILLLAILAGTFYPLYLVFMIVLVWLTRLYYQRRFNMVYPSLR